MKTKKLSFVYLLTGLLVNWFAFSLSAQVTVGGLENPAVGAILDLNSTSKGGLLLSNVDLENFYTIPVSFPNGATADEAGFTGAMVYNTGVTSPPAGIYVWNGTNWTAVTENCTPLPPEKVILTSSGVAIKRGETVTFAVSSGASEYCAEGESYDWHLNDGGGYTPDGNLNYPESTHSITFSENGVYYVKVVAEDRYGGSCTSNEVPVCVTNDGSLCSQLVDGNYSILGVACYDVNTAFNGGALTKTYTFANTGAYRELAVLSPVDTAGVIVSFSQAAATAGSSSTTFSITFKSNISELVPEKGFAGVQLWVSYKNNSDAIKTASLDVYVKDIDYSLCPGVVICGGVHDYAGANNSNNTGIPNDKTYADLLNPANTRWYFERDASKDLCVYYRDALNSVNNGAGNTFQWWSGDNGGPYTPPSDSYAVTLCDFASGVHGVDVVDRVPGSNWRLPNIAELGQMATDGADESPKFNALSSAAGADTRTINMGTNPWSSTEHSSKYTILWSSNGTYSSGKTFFHGLRCVRTMD
jgi:hypothetical protein